MIRHLTPADFRVMPWANGRGTTTELWREDREGRLWFRISRASVVEDGPFSLLPGVWRVLTVLTGPGFDLVGEGLHLKAAPFVPVAFPGGVSMRATGVTAPCDDFNVMVSEEAPRPEVRVLTGSHYLPARLLTAIYCTGSACVGGLTLAAGELVLTDDHVDLQSATPVMVVSMPG